MGQVNKCIKLEKEELDKPPYKVEDGTTAILNAQDLNKIFSHLGMKDLLAARCVCIRWRNVSENRLSIIKKFPSPDLQMSTFTRDEISHVFPIVMSFSASNITHLDLSSLQGVFIPKRVFGKISDCCCNLFNINFSNSSIDDEDMFNLSEKCKKIKIASFSNCANLNEYGLYVFFRNLPFITSLNISINYRIFGECFNELGGHLESLFINDNHALSEDGFSAIVSKCISLSELEMVNVSSLDDNIFSVICRNSANLKKLKVKSYYLTIAGYMHIGQITSLEELAISQQANVNNSAVIEIARKCCQLKIINISGPNDVDDVGLQQLSMCKDIVDLDIGYLNMIHDNSLISIGHNGNLRKLCARGCTSLTDESFCEILNYCPNLEDLDISSCHLITNGLLDSFLAAVKERTNNIRLTVTVGGTCITQENNNVRHTLLSFNYSNLCNAIYLANQEQD